MDTPKSESTAARLRLARLGAELTQREVARYMELTKQCISHWESGRRAPDIEHLQRLGALYNIPWQRLVDGKAAEPVGVVATTNFDALLTRAKEMGYEAHFDFDANGQITHLALRPPKP